eukprot:14056819-Alexandrium_andersonii.AAC.1
MLAACWSTPAQRVGGRVWLGAGRPSDEERKQHECTRVPVRSWCQRCVRGRMPNLPHLSAPVGAHE